MLDQTLEEIGLGIGHRLRGDILRYLAYAEDLSAQLPYGASFGLDAAFDYQLTQRVVPRLFLREPDPEVVADLLAYSQGERFEEARFPRTVTQLEAIQKSTE